MFNFISEISPNLYQDDLLTISKDLKIFLTFDLDWCHEAVLEDTIQLLEKFDVKATFFCTDKISSLDLLRGNKRFELGIHPNFRPLLDASSNSSSSASKILDQIMSIIPEAKSVRSHSLISGSNLSALFFSRGLTHESNLKIPLAAANDCKPFFHSTGIIMCPFQWGDYSEMGNSINLDEYKQYLTVNFHPIHIFLNSDSLDRYEHTRPIHQNPSELRRARFEGRGVRDIFIEFLKNAHRRCEIK